MANINNDRFLTFEVQDYIKSKTNNFQMNRPLEVVNVNSTAFNNGTGRDYKFCHDIFHPETGERLKPVKGYVGHDELGRDRCYYAEYQDVNGKTYSYAYQFAKYDEKTGEKVLSTKSIEQQMKEDLEMLKEKVAKEAEAKEKANQENKVDKESLDKQQALKEQLLAKQKEKQRKQEIEEYGFEL
ncbi:MAG: hypothetical protein IJX17_01890 [Clostridia bacterium]|nr:hypothetical protein [Clostridia bacterium]